MRHSPLQASSIHGSTYSQSFAGASGPTALVYLLDWTVPCSGQFGFLRHIIYDLVWLWNNEPTLEGSPFSSAFLLISVCNSIFLACSSVNVTSGHPVFRHPFTYSIKSPRCAPKKATLFNEGTRPWLRPPSSSESNFRRNSLASSCLCWIGYDTQCTCKVNKT